MKILFLTDNFPPEVNAPATRTYEHCVEWVKKGVEVTVITGVPNFPKGIVYNGYKNKLYQKEIIDGIQVIRVLTFIAANKGFLKRIVDYISFAVSSFIVGLFVSTDLIVATSPQFFTAISGRYLSFWKRVPWVMEVRDLWPESIKTVGAMKDNLIIRYFEYLEKKSYQSAIKIITNTDAFKKNIVTKGIAPSKIEVVKNGANLKLFFPRNKNEQLLTSLQLKGKKIFGFVGTLGMAHNLDFILDAAKAVNNEKIHFLLIGEGSEKERLKGRIHNESITNITLLEGVEKQKVPEYLSILDVALVNLKKDPLFKTVIPSKIFESAAMGNPILIGVDGESRNLVEKYNAGIYYDASDVKDFILKMNLILDSLNYNKFKKNTLVLAKEYDRVELALRMLKYLKCCLR